MANISVLGFYGRGNLGDEAFKYAFPLVFPGSKFSFLDIDSATKLPEDTDIVICGGGDIISDYFIPKIENLTKDFKENVVLFSVGIPYQSYITPKVLDLFDYIYLRNTADIKNVSDFIGHKYVRYIPDIVFAIPSPIKNIAVKKVGVFMHKMASSGPNGNYILNSIAGGLKYIASKGYYVFLYRFNYSGEQNADDSLINQQIKTLAPICNVDNTVYSVDDMYKIFGTLNFAICGRLHSHIMAVGSGTPLISISSTRKSRLFMQDMGLSDFCIKVDETPVFYDKIVYIIDKLRSEDFSEKIAEIATNKRSILNNTSYSKIISLPKRIRNRRYNQREYLINYVESMYYKHFEIDIRTVSDTPLDPPIDSEHVEDICKHVCFEITKVIDPEYLWGFVESMRVNPTNYITSIDYIINDSQRKFIGIKKFNIDYFNQGDFNGLHRSGWPYVLEKLSVFNTPDGIYLDTYMDRTFHWGEKVLLGANILPYTQHWVGIVHHTPDTDYSDYNVEEMFDKESLRLSLHMCKGIYTLSHTLKTWVQNKLKELGFLEIVVEHIYHPTEVVGTFWTPERFKSNPDKKIINIGAWLRDMFAIYELCALHKTLNEYKGDYGFIMGDTTLRFAALKGKKMDHYFKPDIVEISNYTIGTDVGNAMCRTSNGENKWIEGLSSYINTISSDVETLSHLDNVAYDNLLASNVVFLKLVDSSACNTLMECVARNTPILINPHPAVVEILGEEYPLYYESLYEAHDKLTMSTILKAHEYIKAMDKGCINAEVFVKAIKNSEIFTSI